MSTLEALMGGNAFLIAIIGFFLRRTLHSISDDVRLLLQTQHAHTTALAVQETRLAHLEAEFAAQRVKYDDLAGFLQSQGFRKRDGHLDGK